MTALDLSMKFKSPKYGTMNLGQEDFKQFFKEILLDCGLTKTHHVIDRDSGKLGSPGIKLAKFDPNEIKFAETSSSVPIDNFTTFIQKVIRDIGSSEDTTFPLTPFFPDVFVDSYRMVVDIMGAITGTTQARMPGQNFPQAPKIGNRTYEFAAPYWGEEFLIDEQDIFVRALGNQDMATNGLPERIGFWVYQAYIRQLNLKKNLICTLFNNGYTYNGQSVSYGIPSGNRFVPITAPWALPTGPGGKNEPNPVATPLFDLRDWMNSTAFFYKYRGILTDVFMNVNTHRWFFDNPNNQNTIQYSYANAGLDNKDLLPGMNAAFKYFVGSDLNVSVNVDAQQYIPDANDPFGNPAGIPTFFIPDGYILFGLNTKLYGGTLGEFCYTKAAQNGGMYSAQPGPYIAVQDNTLVRYGLTNPSLSIVSGFNGGLKLDRSMDIVTAYVLGS